MKKTVLMLAFLACFAAVNGFSLGSKDGSKEDIEKMKTDIVNLKKTNEDTAKTLKDMNQKLGNLGNNTENKQQTNNLTYSGERQNNDKLIPLTWETAKEFEKDLDKLDVYISRSLNLSPKEQNNNYGVVKDGKIVDNSEKNLPEEKLVISDNTSFKIVKFSLNPKSGANIDIFISGPSAWLKFTRNTKDCFKLDSITKNTKNYSLPLDGEVLLYIYDERSVNNRISEQKTSSSQTAGNVSSGNRPKIPENILLGSGQPYPYLTKDAVVEYLSAKSKVSRRDIEAIINHYINESKKENINHDIAIAQMCYATQFLTSKTLFNNMNYAGLITQGAVLNGKSWNGKFPESQIGVRAHIQHLKGYASIGSLNEKIVDPRFSVLANLRGKGDTLHNLSAFWVKKNQAKYENDIKGILEDLYRNQENYNKRF